MSVVAATKTPTAFHIASTGRPGPVLVDVAKSAQQAMTTFAWPTELSLPGYRPVTRPHTKQIREATRLILESHHLPNDLNLRTGARASVAATGLLCLLLALTAIPASTEVVIMTADTFRAYLETGELPRRGRIREERQQ